MSDIIDKIDFDILNLYRDFFGGTNKKIILLISYVFQKDN